MTIELYIQGQRVELFKDESITITESIQNVKDIEKVFTAFTQSFSVPASKTNNKIFKHYYNFDIIGGFDARKKVSAAIELNSMPFQTGKIKLEGVDMKNNKPHTYRITFFGDIVELKDQLGEKKLSDLDFTSYQPLNYDATTVEAKMSLDPFDSSVNIVTPLITHSQRLFYDSDQSNEQPDDGNLYWHTGGGNHKHGVKWNELKYAIRVNKIIEAIEALPDFQLSFSTDFFKNTNVPDMQNLYMWLHRKSGAVEDLSGSTTTFETIIDGWTPTTITDTFIDYEYILTESTFTTQIPTFGATGIVPNRNGLEDFEIRLETADTDEYDVALLRDGTTVFNKTGQIGSITISADPNDTNTFEYAAGTYEVVITSSSTISFSNIYWYSVYYEVVGGLQRTLIANSGNAATGTYNTNSTFTFNINKQIPDMKIIDFLTGLFKTFNLTAFVENDVIIVKPLNDFYANPTTYDITEFIDVNSSKVDVALPYREIEFKFKDTKTFLANKFGELNNRDWGSAKFKDGENDLAGKLYKIELPFGHMLYERLTDANTGNSTFVQYGYSVDNNQNAYLGSPLLFYPVPFYQSTGISFVDAVNEDNVAISHKEYVNKFLVMPFNTVDVGASTTKNFQLNFNEEISEWSGNTEFKENIFTKYYRDYIVDVFNTKTRLTKLKAYLPLKILLNYNLGDTFIVAGNAYKINSISTNLLTGESNLELLNKL